MIVIVPHSIFLRERMDKVFERKILLLYNNRVGGKH